jgi:predicted transcriptional regulator
MTMKARKIKIGIRDFDETLDEVAATARAAAAGKKLKPKGHRLFFTSPEALRRFLTPKRLELIRLIRKRHPSSINELAALVHRDFKRVYQDVRSLADAGLVDLAKNGGRKTAPRVADELHLEIVV